MDNYISWSILILTLIGIFYAATIIKGEKNDALKTASMLEFSGLLFPIPRWWTRTCDEEDMITFERKDTRYDWKATFLNLKKYSDETSLQNIFEDVAIERGLIFDKDFAIIHSPSELKELYENGIEALRVEGTATEKNENRLYYDGLVIKAPEGFIFLESKASVLNGLLEGPFFEQMIQNIKLKS
jgi:hypothetical protein